MEENVIKEYPEEILEINEENIKKYMEGISENNPAFFKRWSKSSTTLCNSSFNTFHRKSSI